MKEYLLIMWVASASPSDYGVQMTMVTRQQCYAVVEIYRNLETPLRASCFPPHAKYSTGGAMPATHSFSGPLPSALMDEDDRLPPLSGDEALPRTPPLPSSGPDADRKAP